MKTFFFASVLAAAAVVAPSAQQQRPLSPPGTATTMVGGTWAKDAQGRESYQGGKWIEVAYSRPMLRQRTNVFGTGADYGKTVLGGAPVWRVGANQTTMLKTEVALNFGGKTLPAGEYGMLVDLKEGAWTLIFTTQGRQVQYSADNKTDLWGGFNYTPDKDVIRVPMMVDASLNPRVDQLTIVFCDVTKDSGKLAIVWDTTIALAEFTVAG